VRATFDDDQLALAEAARSLAGGLDGARAARDGRPVPADPTRQLAEGYAGLGCRDEAAVGGSPVDAAIVVRELGRCLSPTAWVPHLLAVHTAEAAGLPVADGMAPDARWALVRPGGRARLGADVTAAVVVDGDRVALHDLAGGSPAADPLDVTRPALDLHLGPVRAQADASRPLDRARVLLAAELAGVGDGAVAGAAAHARTREQFGRPIAVFQGVAHQLAQAWTEVELAWSLVLHAAWALDVGDADAPVAVDAAWGAACEAATFAAERAMQVHGGIGITWEGDSHLFLRRALDAERWLGPAAAAHDAVGRAVLSLGGAAPPAPSAP
jgi:alkylation response protein AidB-like acyl-CoA dehydrogenase